MEQTSPIDVTFDWHRNLTMADLDEELVLVPWMELVGTLNQIRKLSLDGIGDAASVDRFVTNATRNHSMKDITLTDCTIRICTLVQLFRMDLETVALECIQVVGADNAAGRQALTTAAQGTTIQNLSMAFLTADELNDVGGMMAVLDGLGAGSKNL